MIALLLVFVPRWAAHAGWSRRHDFALIAGSLTGSMAVSFVGLYRTAVERSLVQDHRRSRRSCGSRLGFAAEPNLKASLRLPSWAGCPISPHFPITRRWPPQHPDRLQLYSLNTPNGVKVSIMLEETGLPYEPHLVDIGKNESWTPEFLSLNPNGKIPAIIDPDGPDGEPLGLAESGAILHLSRGQDRAAAAGRHSRATRRSSG